MLLDAMAADDTRVGNATGGRASRPDGIVLGRWTTRPRITVLRLVVVLAFAVALPGAAYIAAGAIVYDRLSTIGGICASGAGTGRPDVFSMPGVDTDRYLMQRHEAVSFPSRDPRITISAWYVPGDEGPGGPAVIVAHGLGDCRRSPWVLLPAGMLHRAGYSVLLIDLRDHGDSTIEDGRHAGGTDEYLDVLGAWDWTHGRGHDQSAIGLFGESLGAAAVLIAAGEEPRVAAVWEDSSYGVVGDAVHDELTRNGYPTFIAPAGILVARLVAGDDLATLSPVEAVRKLGRRPVFITHGASDTRLSVRFARQLEDAVRESGGDVRSWIVPAADHLQAMRIDPAGYERRLVGFFDRSLDHATLQ
jgi:dipeptidyl aminopeptidase/acylaminoacyl peptidase